jgi:transcription elongation factor GreA
VHGGHPQVTCGANRGHSTPNLAYTAVPKFTFPVAVCARSEAALPTRPPEVHHVMLDKPVLLTKEGLDKLQRELDELRTNKRSEIAERIKYAKEFGDISENAEYEDAKNEQGMLEGRILTLEKMVRNAVLIEEHHDGIVQVGSKVKVKDEFGEEEYTIVGPAEVDVSAGRISMESPVGRALLGHKVGEEVKVQTPGGNRKLTIKKVV